MAMYIQHAMCNRKMLAFTLFQMIFSYKLVLHDHNLVIKSIFTLYLQQLVSPIFSKVYPDLYCGKH